MWRYRYCTKQKSPTCKGMQFGYSDFKDKKYCPFCRFAGHKSRLKTGQCEGYGSRKYLERVTRDENGSRLVTSNQWFCRKCGHLSIGNLVGRDSEVIIVGKGVV